jgi:lipoprotein-releasing system ATP-binding protein
MNKQNVILKCSNVHKVFSTNRKSDAGLHVLKGIDLEIHKGELISIVGASGAGKSTLLHILGGLDRPTNGEVYWGETNISKIADEKLARLRTKEVGFVFQYHHLLPEFTALENVAIPHMILGASMKASYNVASKYLTMVGLKERASHKPSELSGGEQQRVAIARAIANQPRIVLADEPTGNLDSATALDLFNIILELNRINGQTFVLVTHNEKLAEKTHRVMLIEDGKIRKL